MPVALADLRDSTLRAATRRLRQRQERILRHASSIASGIARSQLDTEARRRRFEAREERFGTKARAPAAAAINQAWPAGSAAGAAAAEAVDAGQLGLERKLGPTHDMLPVEYLEGGVEAARAVGRLAWAGGAEHGTGFFVCPELILTNHHVVDSEGKAFATTFETYAEQNLIGGDRDGQVLNLDPDRFFLTNEELDFTLVAVVGIAPDHGYGWLPLLAEQGKILIGRPVNIIQHPNGEDKKVVTQNSHLLDLDDAVEVSGFCWYNGDTEEGSSGAPVLNNRWEVVALHHKAVPKVNRNDEVLDINGRVMSKARIAERPELIAWIANEGIRVSRIVEALEEIDLDDPAEATLLQRTLALWNDGRAIRPGLKTGWLDH